MKTILVVDLNFIKSKVKNMVGEEYFLKLLEDSRQIEYEPILEQKQTRGWKEPSTNVSLCEKAAREILERIPGSSIRNRSVTTSSIYMKTPDGFSLRVSTHAVVSTYKYKWNVFVQNCSLRGWVKSEGNWRFYTDSVDDLVFEMKKGVR